MRHFAFWASANIFALARTGCCPRRRGRQTRITPAANRGPTRRPTAHADDGHDELLIGRGAPDGSGVGQNRQPGGQSQAGRLGAIEKLASVELSHGQRSSWKAGSGIWRHSEREALTRRSYSLRFGSQPGNAAFFPENAHGRGMVGLSVAGDGGVKEVGGGKGKCRKLNDEEIRGRKYEDVRTVSSTNPKRTSGESFSRGAGDGPGPLVAPEGDLCVARRDPGRRGAFFLFPLLSLISISYTFLQGTTAEPERAVDAPRIVHIYLADPQAGCEQSFWPLPAMSQVDSHRGGTAKHAEEGRGRERYVLFPFHQARGRNTKTRDHERRGTRPAQVPGLNGSDVLDLRESYARRPGD